MASHEWCYEFCLSCDRQISEGAIYCSQACRLADIEKAGSDSQSASNLSSSASSSSSSNNGFYLPPAVNFSAYKATPASRGFDMGSSSNYHYYPTTHGSYFAPPTATRQSPQRSLTPSSSRSSLASNASQQKPQPQPAVSHQAASQLSSYERSFDQTRDMKRRFTSY